MAERKRQTKRRRKLGLMTLAFVGLLVGVLIVAAPGGASGTGESSNVKVQVLPITTPTITSTLLSTPTITSTLLSVPSLPSSLPTLPSSVPTVPSSVPTVPSSVPSSTPTSGTPTTTPSTTPTSTSGTPTTTSTGNVGGQTTPKPCANKHGKKKKLCKALRECKKKHSSKKRKKCKAKARRRFS